MEQPATTDPTVETAVKTSAVNEPELQGPTAEPANSKSKGLSISSERISSFTNSALRFLASASNETLGACAVGLCASTYLLLGRVGLVLIGVAGGVVLQATWETSNDEENGWAGGLQPGLAKRRELGLEVAKRVLDWRDSRKVSVDQDGEAIDVRAEGSGANKSLDYSNFQPQTAAALTSLTDAIIRDYVQYWYKPILPSETTFPLACRQSLTAFILSVSKHLSRKRPADLFLDFLTNSTSIMIVFLSELSTALRAGQGQSPEEAIRQYLNDEPDSHLANVVSKHQQERKLCLVAEDILAKFLEAEANKFAPSKTFLQEIFAGVVLESIVKTCSKAEWINGWIIYLLEEGESEIMNVIDAGVESMSSPRQNIPKSPLQIDAEQRHARRISKAEEAMQEAMLEAKRLTEMIAEEDAGRKQTDGSDGEHEGASLTATTEGMPTPTSSESEWNRTREMSMDSSIDLQPTPDESPPQNATPPKANAFTDFDQLVPSATPTVLKTSQLSLPMAESVGVSNSLTLHNAEISIMDDGGANDKSTLRAKPMIDYLVQIEPVASKFPGWMIVRRYQDFETLHEVLRRISVISGVPEFVQKHSMLPSWKGQTKHCLRQNLERYLQHALQYERLAESEAMKRFLEKENAAEKGPAANKNKFGFQGPAALETMGKGFVNVIGQAPKGLAGGGKAVLGGVQGVFGAVGGGLKKSGQGVPKPTKSGSVASLSGINGQRSERASEESVRMKLSPTENSESRPEYSSRQGSEVSGSTRPESPRRSEDRLVEDDGLDLPPLPSDIPDDYGRSQKAQINIKTDVMDTNEQQLTHSPSPTKLNTLNADQAKPKARNRPLSEEETRASIELIFAVITELYTLSSAWTIRLSLLAAAKTFLLRPNNPQLESIRLLLQDSIIDANVGSDAALAAHISKLRENSLPTEAEAKQWPAELTPAENEKLRAKARKLLMEKGMPPALTGVMGSAASGEALGRVFDCLQMAEIARGLIFALLLQALRASTQ